MGSATELIERDRKHSWHPYTQVATDPAPMPVVGAKDADLILADGSTIIDAISSWWVNIHGHGRAEITEAIHDQLQTLGHVMFSGITHEPAVALAERLSRLLPGNPERIYYSDNGTTAVEAALKIALQYWHNTGQGHRQRIVSFNDGYHGETFGAMSISSRSLFSAPFRSKLFDADLIDVPVRGQEEKSYQQMARLLETGEVACFIFEPILQGVGGMKVHDAQGLSKLLEMCKEYGVITIADEVLTGCGRTGPYFASSQLTTYPDMYCLAKPLTGGVLPLGVTACSEEIYEAFVDHRRDRAFLHGHSYCGNPTACSAAVASLDLLTTDECDQHRNRIAKKQQEAVTRFKNSPVVQRAESIGTILIVELESTENSSYHSPVRNEVAQLLLEEGTLIRPFGNTLHVLPPYCITDSQLEKCYNALETAVGFMESIRNSQIVA